MKLILYISSLIVLVFTILYYVQENISAEWRNYQNEYRELLKEKSENDTLSSEYNFEVKLRQIYLPDMNRIDRCVTCHVSIEDPRFADTENPMKTHPGDYLENHAPEKVGCTICHDGQGPATVWADALAHDDHKYWEKPVLFPPFIEANCYRCHSDLLPQTPNYNRGKKLFETSGCLGCHQRDGKGGYLAPEFRGLGDASFQLKHPTNSLRTELLALFNNNRNLAYIYESVRFPDIQPSNSVMLNYGFSHDDAISLTVYLKSLTNPEPGVSGLPTRRPEALSVLQSGKQTYQLYCRACHGLEGEGGVENPNYQNEVIPELNLISERMFLFEEEDALVIISAIEAFGDLNIADPPPDLPRWPVVLAQYNAIRDVIVKGNPSAKLDPEGPTPFNMPSWQKSIPVSEIDAVIAYLISLYDFEEEEDW